MTLLERFLKYISIDTKSDPSKKTTPSTKGQLELAKVLVKELNDLNADDIYFDENNCYVYAKIKGNDELPKIGFISHLDTSPDASGNDIDPRIINNYNGKNIKLNSNIKLKVNDNKDLKNHVGKTLITTRGDTLLGADDKAGVAEIMQMIETIKNTEINHGDIYVCFTPDEEIGNGTLNLDYEKFSPDFAYTVDGSTVGELSYENFNAATVKIDIKGINTHTGTAKGKMINAIQLATMINSLLPNERPENTEGYEGFYHLQDLSGDVSKAHMKYLIRDFDQDNFAKRKLILHEIIKRLNKKYNDCIEMNIKDTYYNMGNVISKNSDVITETKRAIKDCGIEPLIKPIRGGTDGARITQNGILCPNIGTGGHNFHSIYEYVTLEDMEKSVEILVSIIKRFSNSKEKTIN